MAVNDYCLSPFYVIKYCAYYNNSSTKNDNRFINQKYKSQKFYLESKYADLKNCLQRIRCFCESNYCFCQLKIGPFA